MSTSRRRIDWSEDRGQVGGIEVLPFGLLVFVIGTLLVANAWAVVDAKLAVTSAAGEAVRSYVEADSGDAAVEAAEAAARSAIAGHGRRAPRTEVQITHAGGGPYTRCTRATVTVRHRVPALSLPFLGGYGDGFDVAASQSEIIDPYRSGLTGEARC